MTQKIPDKAPSPPQKEVGDPLKHADDLFFMGYQLDKEGDSKKADIVYTEAIEFLELLHSQEKENLSSQALARFALEHGRRLLHLNRIEQAHCAFQEAVRHYDSILKNNISSKLVAQLALGLRLLGRCRYKLGDFKRALDSYGQAIAVYRTLLLVSYSQKEKRLHQKHLGIALLGYARVLERTNQASLAKAYLSAAKELLEAAVVSNVSFTSCRDE